MIKVYGCGRNFIAENAGFLNANKYMSSFFFLDAECLSETDRVNFAILCEADGRRLLAIKAEPYNLLLYGDSSCLHELMSFLKDNEYVFSGIMCPCDIGDRLAAEAPEAVGRDYYPSLRMDFMETRERTSNSSEKVEVPAEDDAEAIFDLSVRFFRECGLPDIPNIDGIRKNIRKYRVIRDRGEIVSMAAYSRDTDDSCRITHVYTVPASRGQGFARQVVNTLKNEILDMGKTATLNVDQANPVSNRLYESLGFKKLFSQGIYLVREPEANGRN